MATRQQTKERTRKRLISAAQTLFSKKGMDRPSLDEICAEAGVTRGAFYVHFEDRDALIAAVMDEVGKRFLDSLFAGAGAASIAQAFAESMTTGAYPLTKRGGVRPHQLLEACARSKAIRAKYGALVQDAIARLELQLASERQNSTLRRDVDPHALSVLLLMTAIGAHTMLDLELPLDPPALLGTIARLLYSAQ